MVKIPSFEVLQERLRTEDDGRVCREIGIWTLEKLAILSLYLDAFTHACKRAGGGYYVDGMSGPGLGRVKDAFLPFIARGSPLIALGIRPGFQQCVLLEKDPKNFQALKTRVAQFGDRASLVLGDVNKDMVGAIQSRVPAGAPCFCLLDPEGTELEFATIVNLASLRRSRRPELLILFPTQLGWLRRLPQSGEVPAAVAARLDRFFGSRDVWMNLYTDRVDGKLTPSAAASAYMELYANQIKDLGYQYVDLHAINDPPLPNRKRELRYHLVFASDHSAGNAIMRNVFRRGYALDFPRSRMVPMFPDF